MAIRTFGDMNRNEDAVKALEMNQREVQTRLAILRPVYDRKRTAALRNASLLAGLALK